jgi:hypothetical protein
MGKLRANSILETIVALVIILTLFGIATSFFARVGARAVSVNKLAAEQVLQAYAENTSRNEEFFNSEEQVDSFAVRRRVFPVERYPNLLLVHFYVYDRRDSLLTDWQQYALQAFKTEDQ